jgi:hypothetical protein
VRRLVAAFGRFAASESGQRPQSGDRSSHSKTAEYFGLCTHRRAGAGDRQVEAGPGASDPTAMVDEIEMFIPEKYNSKTELTAEIGPSTGPLSFDLKGDGGEKK